MRLSRVCQTGWVPGHVNHRGWIVLESISSRNLSLCVDLFEDPNGGFGFEHLRADPEDGVRWTAVGSFGAVRYETPVAAGRSACENISWLQHEPGARDSLRRWMETIASS